MYIFYGYIVNRFFHPSPQILIIFLFVFQLQPYPSDDSLQQRFQDQVNWDAFKTLCVQDHVVYNKYINETLK